MPEPKLGVRNVTAVLLASALAAACSHTSDERRAGFTPWLEPTGAETTEPGPRLPPQHTRDAPQAPVRAIAGTLRIGRESRPTVPHGSTVRHPNATVRHGLVADTSAFETIATYLADRIGEHPVRPDGEEQVSMVTYAGRRTVRMVEGTAADLAELTVLAIQIINTALPTDRRVQLAPEPVATPVTLDDIAPGDILVEEKRLSYILGYAHTTTENGRRQGAYVTINTTALAWLRNAIDERSRLEREQSMLDVVAHEIIHAIGFDRHVDSLAVRGSLMGPLRNIGPPRPVLGQIDRDVLLASHTIIRPVASRTELAADLGHWERESLHVQGTIDGSPIGFGAFAHQGLLAAWAEGPEPRVDLVDNPELRGTGVWSGRLLGLTPARESVAGAMHAKVTLASLEGHVEFTRLEHWHPNDPPGSVGSGQRWHDGDLRYRIAAQGNTFQQTGGDPGILTGAFFGAGHEGIGGTLERMDLAAGFGGRRHANDK